MQIFGQFRDYLEQLEESRFYTYIAIFFGILITLAFIILVYSYRSMSYWRQQINNLNATREEVREILSKAQPVARQRAEVIALLDKEPNFKIGGYFNNLLDELHISNKKKIQTITPIERRGEYRETELRAEFITMTMKEITELLQKIAQNPRLYTKELIIARSKKDSNSLDMVLTFATLHPKTELPDMES